jgi:inhibitor of KinA
MQLVPLGDSAVLAYLPDEQTALHLAAALRASREPWIIDVVQAYTSVAVFFSLDRTSFSEAAGQLRRIERGSASLPESRLHVIPCCYELGMDLARVAEHTGLSVDEVMALHSAESYTVYAIGFCPGFPYLGYLPEKLCGVPRLPSPRLRLEPGSVGLTGRQTGIYTEARPGGWNIVGRTPLELVHVADGYFPLRTGDRVQFERIDQASFQALKGQRLSGADRRRGGKAEKE